MSFSGAVTLVGNNQDTVSPVCPTPREEREMEEKPNLKSIDYYFSCIHLVDMYGTLLAIMIHIDISMPGT